MTLTLDQRIALIDADPALTALSKIADLGTCAGPARGGFQKAIDIASSALHAGVERAIAAAALDQDGPTTSAEVASIAGELADLTGDELWRRVQAGGFKARDVEQVEACDALAAKIRKIAASDLGQRQ